MLMALPTPFDRSPAIDATAIDPATLFVSRRRRGWRAARVARLAADRVAVLEHSGLGLAALAFVARRELQAGRHPFAAWLDSFALAAVAAHRTLGLRPHLPQLTAATLAWSGHAVEVPAGEGKTLALALAAVVHALAGAPVHVIHRDDRLALRRADAMRPLFAALDITVAGLPAAVAPAHRRDAYSAQVLYAGATDLVLDALRGLDPATAAAGCPAPAGVCALVDDLDTVLVDDADRVHRLVAGGTGLSVQALVRRYRRLGGVAATLAPARAELAEVYRLQTTVLASIYPDFRRDLGTTPVRGEAALASRLLARIVALRASRRPVLVVTGSLHDVWTVAARLSDAGVPVSLLDAMPVEAAAAVLRDAGRPGAVTLCAGGADVDIVLDPYARAAGGLAVIAVGLGSGPRADRRVRLWSGRQGHPGTVESIIDVAAGRAPSRWPLAATLASWPAWLRIELCRVRLARWRRVRRDEIRRRQAARHPESTRCPEPNEIPPMPSPEPLQPADGYPTR